MIQEGKVKADVLEKAKKEDGMYAVFADFANFLEGVKTRSKMCIGKRKTMPSTSIWTIC